MRGLFQETVISRPRPRRCDIATSPPEVWPTVTFLAFVAVTLSPSPARAGAPAAAPDPFRPTRITQAPRIDGALDEAAWKEARVIDDFLQQLPEEEAPPTERTEVRILYDRDNLYLGVRFFDREPSRIIAWTLQRDSMAIFGDDQFAFCVDSSNNGRDGFWFSTNPTGVRNDAQIFNEGEVFDTQWDAVWEVASRVDEQGWTTEIKLPFFNLRFPGAPENMMGINFFRAIRRKNEEEYSPYIPRNYRGTPSLSLARKMSLEGIERGIRFQPKPYLLSRYARSYGPDEDSDREGKAGLDVKWGVTSNLTADLTYLTDFAQVEADVQQVNLTRFNLFFPEKRDFFLENAGLFQFGTPMDTDIFFSRRIGLSSSGAPIPILGGTRLTGRVGKTSLGLLDVLTDAGSGDPRTNYGVLRLRHDILARSSIGMILTDREGEGGGGGNRVIGADSHVPFHEDWNFDGFYASSRSSPGAPEGAASRVRLGRDGDIWQYAVSRLQVDPGFDPGIGFVKRANQELTEAVLTWRPRPESDRVRQYNLTYSPRYITGRDGDLQSRENFFKFETTFESGDQVGGSYSSQFERLPEPFTIFRADPIDPGVAIAEGDYSMQQGTVYVNTFQGRRVSSEFTGTLGTFFAGHKTSLMEDVTAKLCPHVSVNTHYEWNHVRLPGGGFDTNLWITRFNAAVSPKLFGSALVQANDITDDVDLNLRVDWIHHPGADLFFVYNESLNKRRKPYDPLSNGRSSTFKLTYLFHF